MDLSLTSPWTCCESNVHISTANAKVLQGRLANLEFADFCIPLGISTSVCENKINDEYPVLGLHDAVGLLNIDG